MAGWASGLVPAGDGLLPFTMLIIGSSPTAMNISLIATMQGTGQKEVAQINRELRKITRNLGGIREHNPKLLGMTYRQRIAVFQLGVGGADVLLHVLM